MTKASTRTATTATTKKALVKTKANTSKTKPIMAVAPKAEAVEPEAVESEEKETKSRLESTRSALEAKGAEHTLTEKEEVDLVSEADAALSKGLEQIKEGIDFLNELAETGATMPALVRVIPTFSIGAKVVIKSTALKHYADVLDGCELVLTVKTLVTDGKHFIGTMSDGGRVKVKLIHVRVK